jgi:hypothetical protein
MIGLAGVISGATTGRSEAFFYGIQIGLVVGVLNTTVTILSPVVEWWVDNFARSSAGRLWRVPASDRFRTANRAIRNSPTIALKIKTPIACL